MDSSGDTFSPETRMSDSATSTEGTKTKSVTNRMIRDTQKDVQLIGEVILVRPYQFKAGTREREKAWKDVAERLKERDHNFKVEMRAVRDRIATLIEQVKEKNRRERAASGINVEETEEDKNIREHIEDLIEEEADAERASKEKAKEDGKKRSDGAEMRRRACETYGETQKRLQNENGTPKPKRSKNTGSDAMSIIQKKMEFEQELRKEELARRSEEGERRREDERERDRRYEALQTQMLQQHQQFQQQQQNMLLQQQQLGQQTLALMMTLAQQSRNKEE